MENSKFALTGVKLVNVAVFEMLWFTFFFLELS